MKTTLNAYAGTPHKTIEQLVILAGTRTLAGETPDDVIQDIVDGYGLGWGSVNAELVTTAARSGAKGAATHTHPEASGWKHTPGPWTVGTWQSITPSCNFESFACVTAPDPTGGTRYICECWGLEDEETHGVKLPTVEARANAAIIAAAPDMLATLREACAVLMLARVEVYNHNRKEYPRVEQTIDMIKLVTAKATGAN